MNERTGSGDDRRGTVTRRGRQVQVWQYRLARGRPMIQWSQSRFGALNGNDYVFAVTQGRGRSYAYFKWGSELLYFYTGDEPLSDNEVIEYDPDPLSGCDPGETRKEPAHACDLPRS